LSYTRFARRALAVSVALGALAIVSTGSARRKAGPNEIAPPSISGVAIAGRTLTGNPGSWNGQQPISYKFQWLRCKANAGDDSSTSSCTSISGANKTTYTIVSGDLGFRLRVRVTASNKQGSSQSTSAATSVVTTEGGQPANSSPPTVSGSAIVNSTLTATTGSWVGDNPITFSYSWLRCDKDGNACKATGKTQKNYKVVQGDIGNRLRVRVVAKNSRGSSDAFSLATDVVQQDPDDGTIDLPGGEKSVDAKDVPKEQRLVVDQVRFDPSPVTSRERPINVSIRVTDTRGNVVRNATVFIRSTPRLTSGADNGLSAVDGWITYSLQPLSNFPLRNGYNVQFFVKAYRKGDPSLGGIYGTRLVQVATKTP
jgi:hypothetical protein